MRRANLKVEQRIRAQRTRLRAAPKGTAQGTGHRAQGKNSKRKLIVSLYLAPCALNLSSIKEIAHEEIAWCQNHAVSNTGLCCGDI